LELKLESSIKSLGLERNTINELMSRLESSIGLLVAKINENENSY